MDWVALGRRTGGRKINSNLSPKYSLSFAPLASSLILTILLVLTVTLTLATIVHAGDIFEEGKSDKEILDNLLLSTRYDKRLLPPVQDADFCCGMRSPGDASILSNEPPSSSSSSSSSSPSHVKLLQTQNNSHYTPHQHLRTHLSGTLTVNVSVLLLSLASPDESSLKYEVEFLLQQQWYDPRLRYSNRSRYEFLNAIHHHNDIWLPDTYFIMHGDFKDPLIPVHFALRIYRNGTVNYLMRRHLILSCQGRLNIFPFDDPQCSFAIESISYEQTAITYVWKNDEATLRKSPSLTTLNAYLIRNQTIACPIKASWRGNYSCLKVDLIFTRDRAFYFTTVFIPGIILVTSSFITFWLEWNAVPARVMIGVTTMLNFFTTSNGFRSTLPVVSNLTAMNVWDGVCMCFIYASLLEFVCVNYVGRKRPLHNVVYRPGENPVTQGEKKREGGNQTSSSNGPNEIISCTNCGPNPCTHTANNGCAAECPLIQVRKKEPPHPIRVAKTIDVIARITFPIAYFFFLTFFFIHYKGAT
ncbi:glutamate-gated chloride channel-like isoform X9 [Aphidius gifuensis]|uniref:glutamate-gated chloride channel-like isoform X9 n=1 Tax=Aphidius gifuensis TaxID=684658 RepID=UPI001CDC1513|nr:glutamate-gated chloride channel-like isoform X9 [Aphidius gifuensis]